VCVVLAGPLTRTRPDQFNVRLLTGLLAQSGLSEESAVAGAAGVFAAGAARVVLGTRLAAIDATVALYAVLHADDANAIAACTLNLIDCHAHGVTPVSVLMSSSISWGSMRCSIMFVSISRTWQSGML
jgi:hypothetical protein